MNASKLSTWSAIVGQVPKFLAIGAGICLIVMVGAITSGVIMRYVVGNPLLGINEIVQIIAVALAMLALPYTTSTGAHVRVDLFDKILGRWGRFVGDVGSRTLSVIALVLLCSRAWKKAAEAIEFGDVTNMLELPIWPVYGAVIVGMGLCAAVYALQIVALFLGWTPDND